MMEQLAALAVAAAAVDDDDEDASLNGRLKAYW